MSTGRPLITLSFASIYTFSLLESILLPYFESLQIGLLQMSKDRLSGVVGRHNCTCNAPAVVFVAVLTSKVQMPVPGGRTERDKVGGRISEGNRSGRGSACEWLTCPARVECVRQG